MTRRSRCERGATAVLASILAVLLVGISAFTVDFGRAYVSKRQLQNAADAGALAGAAYYADKAGDCPTLVANSSYKSASLAQARAILEVSRPNATVDGYTVACNEQGEATVDLAVTGSTPVALGAVYGAKAITTVRNAQATLEVIQSGKGLRPYVICSYYAPPIDELPSNYVKVDFPTTTDSSGRCPHDSGNWFTLDCPHLGNGQNGNPDLAAATRDGCSHTVSIVKPQADNWPQDDAGDLYASLRAGCPENSNLMVDYDPDCLTSNPGNITATAVIDAWSSLIGKVILLPVFCEKGTDEGQCNPAGWVQQSSGGNNTMYPIYRFASVKVCGFHWGNGSKNSGAYPGTDPTDKCYGADASPGGNVNYLLLAFYRYQYSGSTDDSDCALDGECDGGARQVRLTK